jgi:hypothetical protein
MILDTENGEHITAAMPVPSSKALHAKAFTFDNPVKVNADQRPFGQVSKGGTFRIADHTGAGFTPR